MTDTTLPTNWTSIPQRNLATSPKRWARRGFAVGLVVAIPMAVVSWSLIFSLL